MIGSSPAIMRSSVDFPQPEGPTKTTNSLLRTSRSTPLMTSRDPNDLRTPFSLTPLISLQPYFTAPSMPSTKRRWSRKKMKRVGRVARIVPDHDDAEIGVVGRAQRRDDERDGLLLVGLQDDQRPEVVVPVGHEHDDDRRRIGRAHHRQVDVEEDLPLLEPVDARGIAKLGGEGLRRLAEVEDDEDRGDRGQDDGRVSVDELQLAPS